MTEVRISKRKAPAWRDSGGATGPLVHRWCVVEQLGPGHERRTWCDSHDEALAVKREIERSQSPIWLLGGRHSTPVWQL
jgi:hypothetical protein